MVSSAITARVDAVARVAAGLVGIAFGVVLTGFALLHFGFADGPLWRVAFGALLVCGVGSLAKAGAWTRDALTA